MANPTDQDWHRFWSRDQSRRFSQVSWSKRRILNVLKPHALPGKKALDAGCGSGFFSKYFCDQGMPTVSLDYAQSALEMAREVTAGRSRPVQADLLNDNIPELLRERYDLIFSDGLLEHFTPAQQDKIIANLSAVLSEKGVLITFVPNRWSPWELIRPLYMPGIEEVPFTLNGLVWLQERNGLNLIVSGGVNTLPFGLSPEFLASRFGMLLYTVARKK